MRYRLLTEKIAEYGLRPEQVAALAASLLNGRTVGTMRLADEDIDLKLRMAVGGEHDLENTLNMRIREHPSAPLLLGDVCRVEFDSQPGFLNRFQGRRSIALSADIRPGAAVSAAGVVQRVEEYFNSIRAEYPEVTLNYAGEFASTQRSFTSLSWAFLFALLLIYLILATQFQSYLQPLIIISAVAFALVGVIYGALLSRSVFTINSFIAIIGVTGVVVNDSLVLIEFINKSYQRGLSRREAIIHGTNVRLRPIMLTTLTTTLGLLPMAIGFPEYSIVWGTMAMTFVTGLCTATLLTIIIIPVEWDLLTAWEERRKQGGSDTDTSGNQPLTLTINENHT